MKYFGHEVDLATVCSAITYGYTASATDEDTGVKFLRITDIVPDRINWETVPFCPISEKDLEKYQLNIGDIVVARTGATTGWNKTIKQMNYKAVYASYLIKYSVDHSIADPIYVGYNLQSSNWYDYVDAIAGGSAQPGANAKQLGSFKFLLPPLPEQKAIASVLSSLDDKIDLLHRQNMTLEAMAETLFRQWFIEEAKEDWEEVPLSEVAVIQNGYAFSSKDYVEKTVNEYEVLKMGHIDKNATLKLNPKRDYVPRKPELKRFVLNYNDIVMPMTDMKDNVVILGVPALVDANDKYVLNQRVARIYLKEDSKLSSIYYLFLQLKDPDFIARLQSTANSGVQVNLSTQAIKDCPIVIPSLEKQAEHRNTITGFYEQISNNRKQIQTLENLRDTLLPKLMSGEVRVQYQTEEVA
ncbi:MAG: hypothetical protein GX664_01175 [Bacteroidales bacterium]|nr:hypothetical protein [Bacteroidales bacterium]